MKILVTGGAGFIGSALVRKIIQQTDWQVLNIDKLTYAGNLESLTSVAESNHYTFIHGDIGDRPLLRQIFKQFSPDAVMNLAAESHVDRSIDGPGEFLTTNVMGTFALLEESRYFWNQLSTKRQASFRFLHISTDEVYGSLGPTGYFSETTPYAPHSPYSASKASSDHLVQAWHHTYGLPTLISNCSNNYGPYQFPEKLIPLMILNAIHNKPLPVYGTGDNIRDWLYVEDHVAALLCVLTTGRVGESYNIGGHTELKNLDVIHFICEQLQTRIPQKHKYKDLITLVKDRPGHDYRYAIDSQKIEQELGWKPSESFESGMSKTIDWYLQNADGWCANILNGKYSLERLGLKETHHTQHL